MRRPTMRATLIVRCRRAGELAGLMGCRRAGELAGLTWRCLDLERARLSVEQQLVPTRGGVSFGELKSASSQRTVALDGETLKVLRKHRETQLLERDFAGNAYVDCDLVFADEIDGPIHPQRLTESFRQLRKAAGLPTGTLHVLRHTAVTLALTAGVPVHIGREGWRPARDDPRDVCPLVAAVGRACCRESGRCAREQIVSFRAASLHRRQAELEELVLAGEDRRDGLVREDVLDRVREQDRDRERFGKVVRP